MYDIHEQTTDDDLKDSFGRYGQLADAKVICDRETGRSRGFAFVTYASSRDAEEAIRNLNGVEMQGRQIRIDRSTPRGSGPRGGGGGGGYGGGRGGGGGGPGPCYAFQRGECQRGYSW